MGMVLSRLNQRYCDPLKLQLVVTRHRFSAIFLCKSDPLVHGMAGPAVFDMAENDAPETISDVFFFSGFWVSDHIFCPVGLINFSKITEETNKQ